MDIERQLTENLTRTEEIRRLKSSLRRRSATRWSVTGGRGTAYGWIRIIKAGTSSMSEAERAELGALLGLPPVHPQGVNIPASNDSYQEYLDRAAGLPPRVVGKPYWD